MTTERQRVRRLFPQHAEPGFPTIAMSGDAIETFERMLRNMTFDGNGNGYVVELSLTNSTSPRDCMLYGITERRDGSLGLVVGEFDENERYLQDSTRYTLGVDYVRSIYIY